MRPDSHDFDDETVIQYVISYMTCGVCGASYRLQDVEVIDGDDAMAFGQACQQPPPVGRAAGEAVEQHQRRLIAVPGTNVMKSVVVQNDVVLSPV